MFSCVDCNESFYFMKGREFLHSLSILLASQERLCFMEVGYVKVCLSLMV